MNNTLHGYSTETRLQMWVRWTIALSWATLIFKLSTETFGSSLSEMLLREALHSLHLSLAPSAFATLHFFIRKLAHFTEYAIFSLLLYHCFLNSNRTEWRFRAAAWSVLVACLYSFTDEFHQLFVPGRTASLIDCGIDTCGAAVGVLGVLAWQKIFPPAPSPLLEKEASEVVSK